MKKLFFVFVVVLTCLPVVAHAVNNCTGATYYDVATDTCIVCPTGYDYNIDPGKDDITDCQIHCDAGTYVPYNSMLSSGYTQLEYLGTTGSQYIDTGITADPMTRVDAEVSFGKVTSGTYVIVGTRNGTNTTDNNVFQWGVSNSRLFNRFGSSPSGDTIAANTLYTVHIQDGLQTVKSGDTYVSITNVGFKGTMDTAGTLYMFCTHDTTEVSGTKFFTSNGTYMKNLKITNSGTVQRDFIPARRNSDGVLGMYDLVSGNFFTNLGTGDFVGGPVFAPTCANAGPGYWAAASTVNYGSTGTRNACPAGTYSNVSNATSATTCITCTGAMYSASGAGICSPCPTGYDYETTTSGKTSSTQCQVHCDGGQYVPYAQLEYIQTTGTQWIDTGIKGHMNYTYEIDFQLTDMDNYDLWGVLGQSDTIAGQNMSLVYHTSGTSKKWQVRWDSVTGSYRNIVLPSRDIDRHVVRIVNGQVYYDDIHIGITAGHDPSLVIDYNLFLGALNRAGVAPSVKAKAKFYSYKVWNENDDLVQNLVPAKRTDDNIIGMYDTVSGNFIVNSGTELLGAGPVVGMITPGCVNVGVGYYAQASTVSFNSVITRTACPAGTTTVGYGHGADSANDCGRTLHVGNNVLYMRKNKETSPSMGIDMGGGDVYYISLSSSNHNLSPVHLWHNGGKYTAYDDSLLYNERNLTTNTQITP